MTQGRSFRPTAVLYFLSIAALFVCTSLSLAQTPPWANIGVGGGGYFSNLKIDPDDSENIYVGSDVTGFFRSNDGGDTWDATIIGLGSYYVGEIALASPVIGSYHKTIFVTTANASNNPTSRGGWSLSINGWRGDF